MGLHVAAKPTHAGAERVIGYSEAEALGSGFGMLFTPSDLAAGEPERELERAWRDGRAEDSRWHLRSDAKRFWASGMTISVNEGMTKWLIKFIRDETAERLADEQRVLLRGRSKSDLPGAAGASLRV